MKIILFWLTVILTTIVKTNNCFAQCDSSLTAKKEIVIPNIFTPDVDGFNDGFNAAGDCITSIDKQIYNRWGELIFESKQIGELWDGSTNSGIKVPEGTYYYIFIVETTENNQKTTNTYKGSLALLR